MASIRIEDLSSRIVSAVREFNDDVTAGIEKEVNRTADAFLRDTRAAAPVDSGRYKSGFKITRENFSGTIKRILWNQKEPYLGHLLEYGHAKVGGGRVAGKPHIRPAYVKNVEGLPERIKSIIRNGG
ncbi:HK97 gp10 family phage protein [Neobacillus mesonae]|nr:HK97 gp10 family phage protein [Neobacillus mesonae]